MIWKKKGLIYCPQSEASWWISHAMAPAAFMLDNNVIRILMGCWDAHGISRIGYIDVSAEKPDVIIGKSVNPILDIGEPGCFDDNGVFPGHVYKYDGKIYLYYTGFQKLNKIPFTNFSGLAISYDGGYTFERVSKVPVMDRADEGLFTRAGTSVIIEKNIFKACYSVGSGWTFIAGKERPIYEVNYIESFDGVSFGSEGRCIVKCDSSIEHGLGRPQIITINNIYYVFYTRRMLNFKYHMGVARSYDLVSWERIDSWLSTVSHGFPHEFDSQMVYFPCVINSGKRIFLFYSGNGYGKSGVGYAELETE